MIALKDYDYEVIPIMVPDPTALKSINFFLFKKDQSLILIDAGFDNDVCWKALQMSLRENGYTFNDITQIILTHHHIDHIGLVNRIVSENLVPVYAHSVSIPRLKRENDFLKMRVEFFTQLYQEMGCGEAGNKQIAYLKQAINNNKANKIDCDIIEITNKQLLNFEAVEVPGHAPDQVSFYEKNRKWLFSGDLLIEHISSNALIEPDQSGNKLKSLIEHINSLKKCLSLEVKLVFPGHGPLIEQPEQLIKKRLERIEKKATKIAALVESGISTGSELAKVYYKDKYVQLFSLVMSEVIGHLDYLESQGTITKDLINGVWHYSIARH